MEPKLPESHTHRRKFRPLTRASGAALGIHDATATRSFTATEIRGIIRKQHAASRGLGQRV